MFGRALRQSSRRVAAISASGRIASVSPSKSVAIAPVSHLAVARSSNARFATSMAPRCGVAGQQRWLRRPEGSCFGEPSTDENFRPVPPPFNAVRTYASDSKASPTEVSSILEQRIRGVQEEQNLAETGRVLSVGYAHPTDRIHRKDHWELTIG